MTQPESDNSNEIINNNQLSLPKIQEENLIEIGKVKRVTRNLKSRRKFKQK